MPELARVAVVFNQVYFSEFSEQCALHLAKAGFHTEVLHEIPAGQEYEAVLVVGIHEYPSIPFMRDVVMLGVQTEQLPLGEHHAGRISRNLRRFHSVRGYYQCIFDWNPGLHEAGIGGEVFIPYGCSNRETTSFSKTHDLVFIGNVGGSPRRQELLESLGRKYTVYPDFSPGFGSRLDEAIGSSKICLNIHFYEDCGFESPRVFDYLSRGAFVLSEHALSTSPFLVGRDLQDFSDGEELFEKIEHFLQNESERNQIAARGRLTAMEHSFETTSRILAREFLNVLNRRSSVTKRHFAWARARVRSGYFAARDHISLKRRRMGTSWR